MSAVTEHPTLDLRNRRCTRCKRIKSWRQFTVVARFPDGEPRRVDSICKECRVALSNDWTTSNREHRRAYSREWMRRKRAKENGRVLLDAAPLRVFLVKDGREMALLADITGVSESSIRRIHNGSQKLVALTTADTLITRLDGVFALVYPLDESGAA